MLPLTETEGLTDEQRDILAAVRSFVDAEIIPVASELDHTDTYPDDGGSDGKHRKAGPRGEQHGSDVVEPRERQQPEEQRIDENGRAHPYHHQEAEQHAREQDLAA